MARPRKHPPKSPRPPVDLYPVTDATTGLDILADAALVNGKAPAVELTERMEELTAFASEARNDPAQPEVVREKAERVLAAVDRARAAAMQRNVATAMLAAFDAAEEAQQLVAQVEWEAAVRRPDPRETGRAGGATKAARARVELTSQRERALRKRMRAMLDGFGDYTKQETVRTIREEDEFADLPLALIERIYEEEKRTQR